jgi:hypothetical protein
VNVPVYQLHSPGDLGVRGSGVKTPPMVSASWYSDFWASPRSSDSGTRLRDRAWVTGSDVSLLVDEAESCSVLVDKVLPSDDDVVPRDKLSSSDDAASPVTHELPASEDFSEPASASIDEVLLVGDNDSLGTLTFSHKSGTCG